MQTQALSFENHFEAPSAKFGEICERLVSDETRRMEHGAVEELLNHEGRELLRLLFQSHIDTRGLGEVAAGRVHDHDGEERSHLRVSQRTLNTIFGAITIVRAGYRAREATTLFPMDAELNLPDDSFSHGVRRKVAQEAARSSFDGVVDSLRDTTGAGVAKRQAEELAAKAAVDFNSFYEARQQQTLSDSEQTSEILVLSFDGKGVVMRHDDLRPATKASAKLREPRLDKRRSKGEKSSTKRMATVAAVYTIAPYPQVAQDVVLGFREAVGIKPQRPRPENKRAWASLQDAQAKVIADAFEEAHRRDPAGKKKWVVLVDGNQPQIDCVRRAAASRATQVEMVLDVIHVLEYLWKASYVFEEEGSNAAELWVTERLLEVLKGKASCVAAGMRRSATLRGKTPKQRRAVDACARYLLKYKKLLRYDRALQQGLPIATGVIEGACRHIVKDRMDITGAKWTLKGAEAILRLRSLKSSGDFDEYWSFHLHAEHQRLHTSRFLNHQPPSPLPPAARSPRNKSHLRLVN